jgi:hypothetical protein
MLLVYNRLLRLLNKLTVSNWQKINNLYLLLFNFSHKSGANVKKMLKNDYDFMSTNHRKRLRFRLRPICYKTGRNW